MTIYLCGFMGCGKSTVGRILAESLGITFTDMDDHIVKKAGMSIPGIFAEKGEQVFRDMETEAVSELGKRGGVIACGGGAMLRKTNAGAAAEFGSVVYIDVPYEVCWGRITGDANRPIVMANTKESLKEIYDERAQLYAAHSDFRADGSGTPEEIAEEIKTYVMSRGQ